MSDIILFGKKDDFAIQLGLNTNHEKIKLCFWVENRKMGSFTKGGELKYSIKAYKKFVENKENYYSPVFENMTPTQIRKYFIDEMFVLVKSNKKEKIEEYNKRKEFELFFGFQFTNDGCFIELLYKNNHVEFIYEPPRKLAHYKTFCKVFDEYIIYCNENNLCDLTPLR
jgi:hypothetical protein